MGDAAAHEERESKAEGFARLEDAAHTRVFPQAQRPTLAPGKRGEPGQAASGTFFLERAAKDTLIDEMRSNILLSYTDFQTALQNVRVELLLKKSSGWGVVGELLFTALSAALLDGIGPIVTSIGATIARYDARYLDEAATDLVALASSHARSVTSLMKTAISASKLPLRSKFAGYPPDVASKLMFITDMQVEARSLFEAIVTEALAHGDDVTLMIVRDSFNSEHANVRVFENHIDALMERFDDNHLDKLGNISLLGKHAGTWEVVRIQAAGQTRDAVIEFRENVSARDSHGETWDSFPGQRFINWVDDDLQAAGEARQIATHGGIRSLSAADPLVAELPHVQVWAKDLAR